MDSRGLQGMIPTYLHNLVDSGDLGLPSDWTTFTIRTSCVHIQALALESVQGYEKGRDTGMLRVSWPERTR